MANILQHPIEIPVGDDRDLILVIKNPDGTFRDITNDQIILTAKRNGATVFTRKTDGVGGSDAEVERTAPTDGTAMVHVASANTASQRPGSVSFSIVLVKPDGKRCTLVIGMLKLLSHASI